MRARPLALVLLLAASAPLLAQEHPNLAKGFAADKAYAMGDVDSVNLFSGNLTIAIPIGQRYPVGGNLSYQIVAYYNSSIWRYGGASSAMWGGPEDTIETIPSDEFNVGLGWSLHFGRLVPPINPPDNDTDKWVYISPDGARHSFYPLLHPDDGVTPNANILYSRDNSYLRLKKGTSPYTVEFPDGTIHEFAQNGTQGKLGYFATKIRDRFGNSVTFTYNTNIKWTITDSAGRQQIINFTDHGTAVNGGRYNVSQIVLKAFGTTANWNFSYNQAIQIDRTTADTYWGNNIPAGDPNGPDPVTVSLLNAISGPEGLTWSMAESGSPAYDLGDSTNPRDASSGLILSAQTPTKGRLRWTWRRWTIQPGKGSFLAAVQGVATRTQDDPIRNLNATWTYSNANESTSGRWVESIVTVTDPLGNYTKHYFETDQSNGLGSTGDWRYGLPVDCRTQINGMCLTRQLFEKGTAVPKRSWFASYAHDTFASGISSGEDFWNTNRRVSNERTRFDDDTGYLDHKSSDFDGYGHYRYDQNQGSFGTTATRILQTHYNPNTGCYPGCGGFTPVGTGAAWVLNTYDFTQQTENGAVDRHEYSFNTGNGSLTCERVLKSGSTRNAADVVVAYAYDATGNRTSESWYGADKLSVGTGSTCSAASAYTYKLVHTYSSGVRATSKYLKPGGADVGFSVLSTTINANTGLVATSWDTANFRTTYTYDKLGRLTETEAAGDGAGVADNGARTTYGWSFGTLAGAMSKVNIYRTCPTGLSGCTSTSFGETQYEYDGFGRLFYEKARRADGTMVKKRTGINAMGWKTNVSEWLPASSSAYMNTSFTGFDVYGRPDTITPPEGANHAIQMSYLGDRSVSRSVQVATSLSGAESSKSTTETYDVFGRLVKVQEPAEGVAANYDYDEGNRLSHVELVDNTNHQHRWFSYDGLGFLRSETHPEKGATGNGSVTYGDYDAKGHAGYRYDTTAARGVNFVYDSAERLTDVNETSQAGGRPLKQFTFDTAAGYGLGKLATATGWTYSPAAGIYPDVKVTESYTYSGREGRISAKSTQVNEDGVDTESYGQAFTWSPGGELVSEKYPQCFNGACGAAGQLHFISTSTYTHGYPTATGGFITGITYHESGMVAAVTHLDGTVDTIEEDAYGKARPGRIHADLGATVLFDTGSFAYDGSGNIEAMGSNRYRYDGVSRLAQAQIVLPSGTYDQSYDVDPFGNLQAITTTPAGGSATIRNTPTNRDTNRLTSAVYDAGGNANSLLGNGYTYDVLNRMVRNQSGGEDWFFAYTADDERIEMIRNGGGGKISTLRGLDSQVLRETRLEQSGAAYSDLIRWNGKLGTKKDSAGVVTHYHLDHLGTPRVLTDLTGAVTANFDYYPYGEEIVPQESTERMRFTGHERDLLNTNSGSNFTADDLDYLHARHESPLVGRFLASDRHPAAPPSPQSWNRYVYAQDNPVKYVDRTGNAIETPWDVANVAIDATSLAADLAAGNLAGAALDVAGLAVDLAATAVPGVPGGAGVAIRASRIAENAAKGRAFEKAVIRTLDTVKNTKGVVVDGLGRSIPDIIGKSFTEIKNVKDLSFTRQLRIQALAAKDAEKSFNLVVSSGTTRISAELVEAVKASGGSIFVFDETAGTLTKLQL
jgi:RHS repeat-associated protein